MMEKWEPNALEMMQAMVAVSNDLRLETEAILLHAAPTRDDELDQRLIKEVSFTRQMFTRFHVINGLTRTQCIKLHLAYNGYEQWQKWLCENFIEQQRIIVLPASWNTAEESRNFLLLIKERGWKKVAIASYPHHILRCFLQIVALMKEMDMTDVHVSCATFHGLDWHRPMKKPVLGGQTVLGTGDIAGTLPTHIAEEFNRIVAYAQDPKLTGKNYTRHATIPEMFKYLERRKSIG